MMSKREQMKARLRDDAAEIRKVARHLHAFGAPVAILRLHTIAGRIEGLASSLGGRKR